MNTNRLIPCMGLLGLCGLAVLGFGALGGCSAGEHGDAHHGDHKTADGHEGHEQPKEPADAHKGHEHGEESAASQAPTGTTPAAKGEMKPIKPSGTYPLTTCVVSGDSLTEMGGPVAFEYDGTEVQFCCDGCVKKFKKDPEAFLAKIRVAKK